MKKQYDTKKLTDELSRSVFFQEAEPQAHATDHQRQVQEERKHAEVTSLSHTREANERSMQPTTQRNKQETNVPTNERTKIRHTFDIFHDQLLSLREISLAREKLFGKRVLIGELAQEALDRFIKNERNKEETNV